MKKYLLTLAIVFAATTVFAQSGNKPIAKEKAPSQKEIDKMLDDEMKGMSEDDKAEMRKMMKDVMPSVPQGNNTMAYYPEFTSNEQLVPKKNVARIAAMSKKKLVQTDMAAYASTLYNKLMTKGDAAEIALAKKIIAQNPKANAIGAAAVLCMLQGHPQAAMALSMKAVQTDPSNANWQNNMASLLTQYGYPEQAIPVLQKLKNQFPKNSTVLNNLGQAWLALGDIDSAKININMAGGLNPSHPEAKETEGVIEEITGNTDKATDDYIKAIENAISPFTEMLIKNNNGQSKFEKIDFEKLKRSITIYEYFPKDWITIPKLSDSVSGYENDMSIKNGYGKMFEELSATIDTMAKASSVELVELMDRTELMKADSTTFAAGMKKETLKGLNMMSKPAVIVQNILQAYLHQWLLDGQKEGGLLMENINTQRMVMTKSGNNDKCRDYDRKNNEFLAYANPLVRKFHAKRIEEFRVWLNAFCTWSWYLAGNPKNTILSACIAWTGAIKEMYQAAIDQQYAEKKSCVNQNGDGVTNIPVPAIPNFTCPTIVNISIGTDWQQLNNETKNFNENTSGIKNNSTKPVPNASIGLGLGSNYIAEPGKAPFMKTANGSISLGMINEYDPLEMLKDYPYTDDLTPLPKISPDDLTPLPDRRKNKMVKALLKKMMSADCKNIKKYKYKPPVLIVGLGELVLEKSEKEILEVKEDGDVVYVKYDDGSAAVFMEDGSILEIDAPRNSEKEAIKSTTVKPKAVTKDASAKNKTYGEMQEAKTHFDAYGLQPSISSGIQAPGTFTPQKGLFN